MDVIRTNSQNFSQDVLESTLPVMVDFYADWCGPCKMLSPVLHQLAQEHEDFRVCQVNVDESMDLAQKYGISSIPALLVFKNGEIANRSVGFQSKEALLTLVK